MNSITLVWMGSTIKTEFNNIIIVRCMTANFSYANLRQRILPTPQVFISGYANTWKKFSIAFINYLPLKTTTQEKIKKKIYFADQNISSYNIDLTMGFLNWPIKTYILSTTLIWQWDFSTGQSKLTFWKSGGGVFTTRVSLGHTTLFTYSHANTPLGQSESTHYLSYFIIII